MPGVSESTFSDDLCTPSGWWAKKLSTKGIVNADNTIANTDTGYSFLASTVRQVDIDTDGNAATTSTTGGTAVTCAAAGNCADTKATVTGFVGDLSGDNQGNPLGASGLNYCQCRAVTNLGCDPKGAIVPPSQKVCVILGSATGVGTYLGRATSATSSLNECAANPFTTVLGSTTSCLLCGVETTISEGDNNAQLAVLDLALKQIVGTDNKLDKQSDVDKVTSLLGGLSSTLSNCAVVNINYVDGN